MVVWNCFLANQKYWVFSKCGFLFRTCETHYFFLFSKNWELKSLIARNFVLGSLKKKLANYNPKWGSWNYFYQKIKLFQLWGKSEEIEAGIRMAFSVDLKWVLSTEGLEPLPILFFHYYCHDHYSLNVNYHYFGDSLSITNTWAITYFSKIVELLIINLFFAHFFATVHTPETNSDYLVICIILSA